MKKIKLNRDQIIKQLTEMKSNSKIVNDKQKSLDIFEIWYDEHQHEIELTKDTVYWILEALI